MGRATFTSIGCTTCHGRRPIASDRRIADLETNFSEFTPAMPMTSGNPFNRMFAVATAFVTETSDVADLPTLKRHSNHSFVVRNIFTDFKRHDLGLNFHERNYEGTLSTLFITEPLWGVGTTAPYGHDGRSDDAGGRHPPSRRRGAGRARRLRGADPTAKSFVIDFLQSLVLFPPDDTRVDLQNDQPGGGELPAERPRRHRAHAAVQQPGGLWSRDRPWRRHRDDPRSAVPRLVWIVPGVSSWPSVRPPCWRVARGPRSSWIAARSGRRRPRAARHAVAELLAKLRLEPDPIAYVRRARASRTRPRSPSW
jgi:hypothetical protein